MYHSLPEEIVATTPEDVGTIIWIVKRWDKVGEYVRGSSGELATAYQRYYKITVIDKTTNKATATYTIRGSDPPSTVSGKSMRYYGSDPKDEVINYIKTLPRND